MKMLDNNSLRRTFRLVQGGGGFAPGFPVDPGVRSLESLPGGHPSHPSAGDRGLAQPAVSVLVRGEFGALPLALVRVDVCPGARADRQSRPSRRPGSPEPRFARKTQKALRQRRGPRPGLGPGNRTDRLCERHEPAAGADREGFPGGDASPRQGHPPAGDTARSGGRQIQRLLRRFRLGPRQSDGRTLRQCPPIRAGFGLGEHRLLPPWAWCW